MTASDHLKHRTGSLGGDQIPEEAAEALASAEYQPHRFGNTPAWFAACVRLAKRALTAEAALAQKTREVEEQERDWWVRLGKFRKALHEAGLHGHYNLLQEHFEDESGQWECLVAERDELRAQVEQLQRQVAEMSKPVTPHEFSNACDQNVGGKKLATDGITIFNRLLTSRARTK